MVDRYSISIETRLITDKAEIAQQEIENAFRLIESASDLLQEFLLDKTRKLRPSDILNFQRIAVNKLERLAGTYRNTKVRIFKSRHTPPDFSDVPKLMEEFCDSINYYLPHKSPFFIAAYSMWRLNWIHPFSDGNGRTSRTVSYFLLQYALKTKLIGSPSIPEFISENKTPYYDALEAADESVKSNKKSNEEGFDVSKMENYLKSLLIRQLNSVIEKAEKGQF